MKPHRNFDQTRQPPLIASLDASGGFVCPDCGKRWETLRGYRIHWTVMHRRGPVTGPWRRRWPEPATADAQRPKAPTA